MIAIDRGEISYVFPTVILHRRIPDVEALNAKLRELILTRQEQSDGMQRSNVGGWHSDTDFFKWDAPEVGALRDHLTAALHDLIAAEQRCPREALRVGAKLMAWANVSRRGDFNRPHVHNNANWSGVYYVDVGRPQREESGRIEFLDPRHRPNMFQTVGSPLPQDVYGIRPRNGTVVIFPSWLYHYVNPYDGDGDRISIAFNATIMKLETRQHTPASPPDAPNEE